MKKCSKCKEVKDICNFSKDSSLKDGMTSQCKSCRRAYTKNWRSKNIDRTKKVGKKWRETNKEHLQEYQAQWREENQEYGKEWYNNNKDKQRKACRAWNSNNREKIRENERNRLKTDIQFALAHRLRKRMNHAIRGSYKSGSAVRDLGCTIEQLKTYIESLFTSGMTWANYGEWHIDHIRPLAVFDLSNREQFLEACHYYNLQPLWAKDNLSKGSKFRTV